MRRVRVKSVQTSRKYAGWKIGRVVMTEAERDREDDQDPVQEGHGAGQVCSEQRTELRSSWIPWKTSTVQLFPPLDCRW